MEFPREDLDPFYFLLTDPSARLRHETFLSGRTLHDAASSKLSKDQEKNMHFLLSPVEIRYIFGRDLFLYPRKLRHGAT